MKNGSAASESALPLKRAKRITALGEYFFDELVRLKKNVQKRGGQVIDLSVGDPDLGAPLEAVRELQKRAENPDNHHYASYKGLPAYRQAVANWYRDFFAVDLDPETEVLALIGSKGGMTHLPLTLVNPGDSVLLPDPAYSAYAAGIAVAEGVVHPMPLLEKNGYLPDLTEIPSDVARSAKLMFLNYPNNPTTACASLKFFEDVVDFARQHEVFIAHDAPYNLLCFDGEKHPSFLEARGAKDVGVEFHSFSKLFNMTGWRISFVSGNRDLIDALGTLRGNFDMGPFIPIQQAAAKVLGHARSFIDQTVQVFQRRRDVLVEGLERLGWPVKRPRATFYCWVPVPEACSTRDFTCRLLNEAHILVAPGTGFGPSGEGYIRFALTVSEEKLQEVVQRLQDAGFVYPKQG